MAWPGSPGFVKTNVDAGTDNPAAARSDLYNALTDLESVIAGRGQASGVAPLDGASRMPQANLPTVLPMFNGFFVDTGPGSTTWTIPAGVTRVMVFIAGGGGGGGYTSVGTGGDHGGGGGAGGVVAKLFTGLTPGNNISYTIGAAGTGAAAGAGDATGASGGQSTATDGGSTITANGGTGGIGGGTRFGGGGGSATGGTLNLVGGAGASGATRGGMGGSNMFAGAMAGGSTGFGGGGFGSGSGTAGFDGGPGGILILW